MPADGIHLLTTIFLPNRFLNEITDPQSISPKHSGLEPATWPKTFVVQIVAHSVAILQTTKNTKYTKGENRNSMTIDLIASVVLTEACILRSQSTIFYIFGTVFGPFFRVVRIIRGANRLNALSNNSFPFELGIGRLPTVFG